MTLRFVKKNKLWIGLLQLLVHNQSINIPQIIIKHNGPFFEIGVLMWSMGGIYGTF